MGAVLLIASILLSSQDSSAVAPSDSGAKADAAADSKRLIAPPAKKLGASAPADPSPAGFVLWTFAVLAAMAGGAALLRRFLKGSTLFAGHGPIAVIARRSIGPRQDLVLVGVRGRVFLIGATKDRLTTLGEFQDRDEAAGRPEIEGREQESEALQAIGA